MKVYAVLDGDDGSLTGGRVFLRREDAEVARTRAGDVVEELDVAFDASRSAEDLASLVGSVVVGVASALANEARGRALDEVDDLRWEVLG